MSMSGPKLGIEQKLANTFAPYLLQLHRARRRKKGTKEGPEEAAAAFTVVDVGVNDGSEIHTWFEVFAAAADADDDNMSHTDPSNSNSSRTSNSNRSSSSSRNLSSSSPSSTSPSLLVLLFEPQQKYLDQIVNTLHQITATATPVITNTTTSGTAPATTKVNGTEALRWGREVLSLSLMSSAPSSSNSVPLHEQLSTASSSSSSSSVLLIPGALGLCDMAGRAVKSSGKNQGARLDLAISPNTTATLATMGTTIDDTGAPNSTATATAERRTAAGSKPKQNDAMIITCLPKVLNVLHTQQQMKKERRKRKRGEEESQTPPQTLPPHHHERRINFMKIDAEGADPMIIHSLKPLLEAQRIDMLVFEGNEIIYHSSFPVMYHEALELLESLSYRIFVVGYWNPKRRFVLAELDSARSHRWKHKLETFVAVPYYSSSSAAARATTNATTGASPAHTPDLMKSTNATTTTATSSTFQTQAIKDKKHHQIEEGVLEEGGVLGMSLMPLSERHDFLRWAKNPKSSLKQLNAAVFVLDCFGAIYSALCGTCGGEPVL